MDDYTLHEILHMTAYFERTISEELFEHRYIMANPEWLALTERVLSALAELYQAIGRVHLAS